MVWKKGLNAPKPKHKQKLQPDSEDGTASGLLPPLTHVYGYGVKWIRVNDPSAGSPTETLLRLLLPLSDKVY